VFTVCLRREATNVSEQSVPAISYRWLVHQTCFLLNEAVRDKIVSFDAEDSSLRHIMKGLQFVASCAISGSLRRTATHTDRVNNEYNPGTNRGRRC